MPWLEIRIAAAALFGIGAWRIKAKPYRRSRAVERKRRYQFCALLALESLCQCVLLTASKNARVVWPMFIVSAVCAWQASNPFASRRNGIVSTIGAFLPIADDFRHLWPKFPSLFILPLMAQQYFAIRGLIICAWSAFRKFRAKKPPGLEIIIGAIWLIGIVAVPFVAEYNPHAGILECLQWRGGLDLALSGWLLLGRNNDSS